MDKDRILVSVLVLVVLSVVTSCTTEPPPITTLTEEKEELDFTKLVWSDEFDGAELNMDDWNYMYGTGDSQGLVGWGNNELQYYTDRPDNVRVENGELVITALSENMRGSRYTSARLNTAEKVDVLYGRIEARIKIPNNGKGLWPAFWMLPTDSEYGTWAASGEIDIMENVGNEPKRVHGTIHFGGAWPENMRRGHPFQFADGRPMGDDYHVYALEWTPDGMTWYVDDERFSFVPAEEWITFSDEEDPDAPFDRRFHILLNLAVGGNWPGNPDADTVFPAEMRVDYVRVYR